MLFNNRSRCLASSRLSVRTISSGSAGRQKLLHASLEDEPTRFDDDELLADLLDLREQVRGHEHRHAVVREGPQHGTNLGDPVGIEPIGGFVEHEQLRTGEQCSTDAQPLTHPERVGPERIEAT